MDALFFFAHVVHKDVLAERALMIWTFLKFTQRAR
jgi:hypothetical protein